MIQGKVMGEKLKRSWGKINKGLEKYSKETGFSSN